jgi:hypothetical protein
MESVTVNGRPMDLGLRSPQDDRTLTLAGARELVVGIVPQGNDERLAAGTVFDAVVGVPPANTVALAWVLTSEVEATAVLPMLEDAWRGITATGSSQTVISRVDWVPLTDLQVGLLVQPGDTVRVRYEATVKDNLITLLDQGTKVNQLQPLRYAEWWLQANNLAMPTDEPPPATLSPEALFFRGPGNISPNEVTIVAEWLLNPSPPDVVVFENGTRTPFSSSQYGFLLLQLFARGDSVDIRSQQLTAWVRPAEKAAV